jgi:hypothetical protein
MQAVLSKITLPACLFSVILSPLEIFVLINPDIKAARSNLI